MNYSSMFRILLQCFHFEPSAKTLPLFYGVLCSMFESLIALTLEFRRVVRLSYMF